MVLGSRTRAVAAAVTAFAAVALAIAVAGRGCNTGDATPVSSVRAFEAAVRAGDRQAVYELLGPQTRERLDQAAKRASELVGGARRYEAMDMVSVGLDQTMPPAASIELSHMRDGRAVVELVHDSGERATINLVEVDGHWRIELDSASIQQAGALPPASNGGKP